MPPSFRTLRWGGLLAFALAVLVAAPAFAAPSFPKLTGRVVDEANILSPQTEATLADKLAALEDATGRQLVVVTLSSLQGYEIEDYGYQLGRHWGIGRQKEDDGALLVVAPNDRKVRIEVGYGLEPVLTDALSSVILQSQVLPRFRDGDMEGGVVAGTEAILQQLSLPEAEAKARVAEAGEADSSDAGWGTAIFVIILIFFFVSRLMPGRRRRSGLASALPWVILGSLGNGRGGGGGWSGGGGWGGGGGGSFGGGGSSGSW